MPFVTPARSVPIAPGVHPDGAVGRAGHPAPQMITEAERDALLDTRRPAPDDEQLGLSSALLSGQLPELQGKNVALLLCGGNIDPLILGRVIEIGLAADGRLTRLVATISDRPGGLAQLAQTIAETGASVQQITHDRVFCGPDVSSVRVVCDVETHDRAHIEELLRALSDRGIAVRQTS